MRQTWGQILRRSALAISLAVLAGASQAYGGYSYQTHETAHVPNAARQGHVASPLGDGRVGLFGGVGRTDVELFDSATEQFVTSRAARTLVDFAGVTLLDGNVLLVDGAHDGVFDSLNERYLDVQKTYSGGTVRFPVLVLLPDGKVFVSGGQDGNFRPKSACGVFDPRRLQFDGLGDLAVGRAFHSAVLVNDHQVLIAGGYGYAPGVLVQTALDSLEMFDASAGRSARIRTALQQARYAHCSVKLPDGRVLIVGGTQSDKQNWLQSSEMFDPNSATLAAGPSLGLGRSGAVTAVLPSGRIAIFGGNYDARAVEIYCPETGTFELAPSLMLSPRWTGFTATPLESGVVLLMGGRVNAGSEVLRKAEIFEEVASETPSAPAMTLATIRQLLTDRDPAVVAETVEWLEGLGPQVKPILETLTLDASDVARQAQSVLETIDAGSYPEVWCVEIWDASGRLDAVWMDSFDCPDQYNAADPDPLVRSIQRVTEGADFTHVLVRFPTYVTYEARVKLFNLVGWTGIAKGVLGESLTEQELARVVGPVGK
jgi:hypothetical protein